MSSETHCLVTILSEANGGAGATSSHAVIAGDHPTVVFGVPRHLEISTRALSNWEPIGRTSSPKLKLRPSHSTDKVQGCPCPPDHRLNFKTTLGLGFDRYTLVPRPLDPSTPRLLYLYTRGFFVDATFYAHDTYTARLRGSRCGLVRLALRTIGV